MPETPAESTEEFETLLALAKQAFPKIDEFALETYVRAYLNGDLTEEALEITS